MSRLRSFALTVPALLLAAAAAPAAPPGFVSPPSTYHYPSANTFVSPANRITSNYFAPPQSYYQHPYANPEPNVAPANRTTSNNFAPKYYQPGYANPEPNAAPWYPPAQATSPPGAKAPYDIPLVPRALQEPEAPPPEPAEIEVTVPPGAEIWFNGAKTQQTGARRLFVSPPLEPGARYSYAVKARWTEGGKTFERSLRVPISAGGRERVTFRE